MHRDAARWVKRLNLAPHPEGGWYRETLRTEQCTTIYYLIEAGSFSAWHRVHGADEVWHHYDGDVLALHQLHAGGFERHLLGADDHHHLVVPAGRWQAAEPVGDRYTLVGCTVAPGFTFERFELGTRAGMLAELPEQERWIHRFARS
jgi:predicted cupin superfamily sugar epimerase